MKKKKKFWIIKYFDFSDKMQTSHSPNIDSKDLFHSTQIYDRSYKPSAYNNHSQISSNDRQKMVSKYFVYNLHNLNTLQICLKDIVIKYIFKQ